MCLKAICVLMIMAVSFAGCTQPPNDTGAGAGTQDSVNNAGGSDVQSGTMISEDNAKQKAIAHAGLTSDEVNFITCRLDMEDGRQVYDVEFYNSNREEYDYEIDAYTGEILKYDYDAEGSPSGSSAAGDGSEITAGEAKSIALRKVQGASESDIREFKKDYDDGRLEYEGTIVYGGMEYEFTIDGYSGEIIDWETDKEGR